MSETNREDESFSGCRAKFYVFQDGYWQGKGTGDVRCLIPGYGKPTIVMYAERSSIDGAGTSRDVLLVSTITVEGSYRLEGSVVSPGYDGRCVRDVAYEIGERPVIILWDERDDMGEVVAYALSFQDSAGCRTIWNSLMSVQPRYHSQKDEALMITIGNEKKEDIDPYECFRYDQKHYIPWYSIQMTTWQSRLWIWHGDGLRCPLIRPKELIYSAIIDAPTSPIEPLFHDWFISHVISFLDLPAIVKLDTALSCFSLRKRWIEALPVVQCPSSVDNFELHAKDSVQWLISRRMKISRLSIVPWYMYTHGGLVSLDEKQLG